MSVSKCYKEKILNTSKEEKELFDEWNHQLTHGLMVSDEDTRFYIHSSGYVMKEVGEFVILMKPKDVSNNVLSIIICELYRVNKIEL